MEFDEQAIIRRVRSGDKDAFGDLVRLYHAPVRVLLGRYVYDRNVRDDLSQEAFVRAFTKLSGYRGDSSFRTWLLGIARNVAREYLRREARRTKTMKTAVESSLADWRDELAAREPDTDVVPEAALRTCLDKMAPQARKLAWDFHGRGVSADDIAGRLGTTANAVRIKLFRIRKLLRQCIESQLAQQEVPS